MKVWLLKRITLIMHKLLMELDIQLLILITLQQLIHNLDAIKAMQGQQTYLKLKDRQLLFLKFQITNLQII
jgi:hypothetical protein